MKILHIISSGGMYGAEAVILNMSRTLNKGPHKSMLGVFSNSCQQNLQLHEAASEQGIESHVISCRGQIDTSVPAKLRHLVQETGADIVHAHGYKADVYGYVALRRSATPIVSTCHTWYDNNLSVRLYGTLDRLVLRKFGGVVAVSAEVEQRLLGSGVPKDRVRFIRNGIDLHPFAAERPPSQHRSRENQVVGLVGRLEREKGVDLFLRAAKAILVELPSTKFIVAGDGPDKPALEALIHHLGIGSHAALVGRKENMPAVYASFDVMVSASRQEGLPIAILEGMASGLPLVATSVGAVPSIIQDGHTGVLVAPENVEALAAAIVSILKDPAQQDIYGFAARRRIAAEFSAERMTSDYLRLYEETLLRKAGKQKQQDKASTRDQRGAS